MITINEALAIHTTLIENFGGAHSIRDNPALDSALIRPFQTFDGQDLYRSPNEKAAALIESIVVNHPFVDGNKRTGYVLMRLLLLSQDLDIYATLEEKYNFVIAVASGHFKYDNILSWLQDYVKPTSGT